MDDSWTLSDGNGQPETTGSYKDGQEDSISKETASKDDQEMRKILHLFWETLQRGRHLGRLLFCLTSNLSNLNFTINCMLYEISSANIWIVFLLILKQC